MVMPRSLPRKNKDKLAARFSAASRCSCSPTFLEIYYEKAFPSAQNSLWLAHHQSVALPERREPLAVA